MTKDSELKVTHCRGTKKDKSPCKTDRGLDKYGYCRPHADQKSSDEDPEMPAIGIPGDKDAPAPPPDTAAAIDTGTPPEDETKVINAPPDEDGSQGEDVPDATFDPALLNTAPEEDPQYAYPSKARCTDSECKGTENRVYSTDKERHRQYRVCLAPKRGQKCPRCGFNQRYLPDVSKRNPEKEDQRLVAKCRCLHPVCRITYKVQLCGKTFSVDGEKI